MSDINAKLQTAGAVEPQELSDLAARKDLHEVDTSPVNSADLATASISPRDVMRVPQQAAIRSGVLPSSHYAQTAVELTNGRSRASSRSTAQTVSSKSSESAAAGIFKNARYSYDGGLLNKVFSLLGNIINVLVQFFLRLLGARDIVAPDQRPQQAKKPEQRDGADPKAAQELEREKRKERRERAEQLVKRQ